jgi:hypothetical protein
VAGVHELVDGGVDGLAKRAQQRAEADVVEAAVRRRDERVLGEAAGGLI